MRIKSIVFLVLCFLQMLPWIVEIVFGAVNTSPLLWVIAAFISTWAIIKITRWTNRKKLAKIRFDLGGWKKRTVLYSFLLGLISYGMVFVIRWMLGGFEVVGIPTFPQMALAAAISLSATFYIALTEEVIFRGFVFSTLRLKHSMFISIVFSMFLFILFHLPKWESLLSSPYLFHLIASGIVFTLVYIKSTTLWHSIGLHWGWNMGAFALVENGVTVVFTEKHSSYGWSDPVAWVSVGVNIILIVVVVNLYQKRPSARFNQ